MSLSDDSDVNPKVESVVVGVTDRASTARQVCASLVASLSSVSFGLAIGYVAPTNEAILREKVMTSELDVSWLGSSFTLGVATGGPLAGPLVKWLGRKPGLMVSSLFYVIGWTMIAGARDLPVICLGRALTGIASGLACVAIPTYIAEITTHQFRGALTSSFSLVLNVGIILAFSVGFIIPWRYLATIGVIFPTLQVLCLLCVPESPRWLLMKGRRQDAKMALRRLRGPSADVTAEFTEMDAAQTRSTNEQTRWTTVLRKASIYKPALLATLVMVYQQLGGSNAVLSYTTNIFNRAGWSGSASLPTLIASFAQFSGVGLSCLTVDRIGRRVILVLTSAVMTLACVTMGTAYYLIDVMKITSVGWLSLASLVLYLFAFAYGMGPVPPVVAAEILPTNVRGPITGAVICVTWLVSFMLTESFPYLTDVITDYGTFWLLAGLNLSASVLIGVLLPETRGRTLEEIARMFSDS